MTASSGRWSPARALGIGLAAALLLIPFAADATAGKVLRVLDVAETTDPAVPPAAEAEAAATGEPAAAEFATAPAAASPGAAGLVAAYAFDASSGARVADSSGAGNDGTGFGGVWTAAGKYGRALWFNGRYATTQVSDRAALDLAGGMTLEAWVHPESLGRSWRAIVMKETSDSVAYGLYASSRRGRPTGVATTGAEQNARGSWSLPLRQWSHVATTYDGSALRLYVNGALAATTPTTGPIVNGSGPLRIGGNAWNEWFHGTIDEVRVYNRALSSSEIVADMRTPISAPAASDTQAPSPPGGLAATSTTSTSVTVGWSASSDDVGVAGYGLYRENASVASTSSRTYTYSGLACATRYSFAVDAVDAAGNRSVKSVLSVVTSACAAADTQAPTLPGAPGATGATASSISISWAASSDNVAVEGYGLYRGETLVTGRSSTSYTFTGLACGTTYSLSVDAYDAVGNRSGKRSLSTSTSACSASDTQAPSTPAALSATGATATSVSVAWGASSDNVAVSGYGVYRNTTSLGTTGTRSYSFTGLTCGTSYTLAVDAYDAVGNRSGKASVSAATSACVPPPPPPVGGLVPPARANTVVNAPSGTTVQSDTYYQNPLGSLHYPNGIQRVTVVGAKQMPGYVNGWQDVWVEGKPDAYMNLGPGVDVDLMQIKRNSSSSPVPSNLTFRYFRMHDLSRTGDKHTDGLQLMAGRNIRFIDGVSENVDVQPFFARDSGSTAGGGPIEDILFQRVTVTGTGGYYAFRISGNDEAASGGNVPTRVKIVDCAGDKNVSIDSAAAKLGSEAINYRKL